MAYVCVLGTNALSMSPMQPIEPMKPMKPMKPMEPMEPMKPIKPIKPINMGGMQMNINPMEMGWEEKGNELGLRVRNIR